MSTEMRERTHYRPAMENQRFVRSVSLDTFGKLPEKTAEVLAITFLSPDGRIPPLQSTAQELGKTKGSVSVQISRGVARLREGKLHEKSPDVLVATQTFVREALETGDINVLSPERRKVLTERFLSPDGNIRSYEEAAADLKKKIETVRITEMMALRKLRIAKTARELIAGQDKLSIDEEMAALFAAGLSKREIRRMLNAFRARVDGGTEATQLLQKPEK